MSDVADILGLGNQNRGSSSSGNAVGEEAQKIMQGGGATTAGVVKPAKKPKGMSREVFRLLSADSASFVSSIQPAAPVANAFKNRRSNALKGKWLWQRIATSSVAPQRQHCLPFHWVKADFSFSDYPYAKFDVHYNHIQYSSEEYESLLQDEQWSRDDTDKLTAACNQFDLRWPVIADRVQLSNHRSVVDLQARYFAIKNVLMKHRPHHQQQQLMKAHSSAARKLTSATAATATATAADTADSTAPVVMLDGTVAVPMLLDDEAAANALPLDDFGFALDADEDILDPSLLLPTAATTTTADGAAIAATTTATSISSKPALIVPLPTEMFDLEREKHRRMQQDLLFKRTREDEQEELKLRAELKAIDLELRKHKKPKTSHASIKFESAPSAATTAASSSLLATTAASASAGLIRTVTGGIISPPSIPTDGIIKSEKKSSNNSSNSSISATGPTAGIPALQSTRLYSNTVTAGPLASSNSATAAAATGVTTASFPDIQVSKQLIDKMNAYLRAMNIPENPIPTRAVCDSVDNIRRDTIALLSLHSAVKKKEKELQLLLNPSSSTGSSKANNSSGGSGAIAGSAAARGSSKSRNRSGAKAGAGRSRPAAKSAAAAATAKGKSATPVAAVTTVSAVESDGVAATVDPAEGVSSCSSAAAVD